MPIVDINQSIESIKTQLNSIKTYTEVSKSYKNLKKSKSDPQLVQSNNDYNQLSNAVDSKKRYQKNVKTSTDNLLDFLSLTNGNGPASTKYLRKKIIEIIVKIEPLIQEILREETIKVLGCSQDQTYEGFDSSTSLGMYDGIFIPVESIDLFGNLKNSTTEVRGKIFYEKETPSTDSKFKPFGGTVSFPMNKQLYDLTTLSNSGRLFSQIHGKVYQGRSSQPLFDIQYVNHNEYGVTGDYYRVVLLNRKNTLDEQFNSVNSFISDYYSTINIVDSSDITSNLVNLLTNSVDIKSNLGPGEITLKSKFSIILERILGLCFDAKREIDVSGNAKVSEIDGVDESFFELTDVDLRRIQNTISNIQTKVVTFVDCDNINLPVNFDILNDELIQYRENEDSKTNEEKVEEIEKIIDSITNNPEWSVLVPSNINVDIAVNKEVINKIPLAIVSSILTPKTLLPIFTLSKVVSDPNNVSVGSDEFLQKYKSFNIDVTSRVSSIFIESLFEILKKDIINLLGSTITDINKTRVSKKYSMILKLVGLANSVSFLVDDHRKCRSLLDSITNLLTLINGVGSGFNQIPAPLLTLTGLLPGTSPERSTINTIQELQALGIPTGPLPDGSPNLMLLYNLATHKGYDKENAENGKIEAFGLVPPITGGYVKVFGKSI